MNLDVRLSQRQDQRLALLPQMLQSIEVLQLAAADLEAFLDRELQQNETLEVCSIMAAGQEPPAPPPEPREEPRWEELRRGPLGTPNDDKQAFLESVPAVAESLLAHVREQMAFRGVPALLADAVAALCEHLDDRGLLPFALADLAVELDVPVALLEAAHALLLTLEPRGIGARDTVEAMLLQAAGDPDLPAIECLLREHLEALGRNKLPEVARALRLSVEELADLLQRVKELNPRPAGAFSGQPGAPVRPEAFVWLRDGVVQVGLDDRAVPELGVNADYAAIAADRSMPREIRDYLRPKLRSARELIGALRHRQETLLRVVEAVMAEQSPFLAMGRSAIRPLRMSAIAERLGMHTSTVSRAIAGKHVQTERGLFKLRDFFDGGRIDAEPAAGQGRLAVAQQIADLVAAEDKHAPLSDDDLKAALEAQGAHAARRTVTKYRKELGIPSSYQRRRFGAET